MGNGTLATDYAGAGNSFQRTTDLVGNADGASGVASFWILPVAPSASDQYIYHSTPTAPPAQNRIRYRPITSTINIDLVTPAGAFAISANSDPTKPLSLGSWHHVLIGWATFASNIAGIPPDITIYIDDVSALGPTTVIQLSPIKYTTSDHAIGGRITAVGPPAEEMESCLSEVYINLDPSTDENDIGVPFNFDVLANRRLFIDGTGLPVELGSDGSTPTGSAPLIYLPDGDPTTNSGTGGVFTTGGTVAACPTVPNPIPLTPRDIIEAVRDEINALKVVEPDDQIRSRLDFAEDNLTDALSKFDASDVRKTAKGVRKAVRFLEKAVEKGFSQAQVTDWSERLCGAVRTIADDEITAAIGRTGDPVKIAEAQDAFADGDLEKLFDEFLEAIREYEKAIKSAVVA